ncbi:hypothetical protein Ferp_0751 [Ferroglobus placidus DSM 10642]|uniref:Uncharacterized protein n=2 Tax=Ferroglobus placidus TaxID=54261 RepID=D3RWQ8_FERPA|nr:hypothetical protein Ferp_0751 [Ferroglobus placidus DSM 10642]
MRHLPTLWGLIFGVYVLMSSVLLSYSYGGLPDLGVTMKVLGYGAILCLAIAASLSFVVAEIERSKVPSSIKRTRES